MSSAETSRRFRHIGLISQQRRLRHLRSLSARNIVGSQWGSETLMETFFTLHTSRNSDAFYTSEKIQDSLNPTWRSFDLCRSCPAVNTAKSTFIVKVWGGHDDNYRLIIEWKVDLKGLYFVGNKIHKDGVRYQPNSVIFGMFEGFYSSADNLQETTRGKSRFCRSLEVEQSSAILTYNTYSLARLHTTQRAIRQTEASVSKVRASIIQKLSDTSTRTNLCSEKEALALRLLLLREEVESQKKLLEKEKEAALNQGHAVAEYAEENRLRWNELSRHHKDLDNLKETVGNQMDVERHVCSQYTARKATLVSELSYIYPILQLPNTNLFVICSANLPNAESYMGKDDTMVSTALGHTSHLILMISRFLQIPLRYPILCNGSRSTIHDHVTEPLADKDRDFPLYTRGKEKFHFNYAVYLLNRNISQLRFALGLATSDLRATLPNLQSLLELKWGIRMSASLPSSPSLGSRPVSMVTSSPKSRTSIGVQASMASPYLSSAPPNYSEPGLQSPVVAAAIHSHDNIPNSPPPPYHISQAAQAAGITGSSHQQATQPRRPASDMRDSGVVVTETEEALLGGVTKVVANGNHESNTPAADEASEQRTRTGNERTSEADSLPNGTDTGDEDEVEDDGVIQVSQLNYNSGDALSQDSLDLETSHIGRDRNKPSSPSKVPRQDSSTGRDGDSVGSSNGAAVDRAGSGAMNKNSRTTDHGATERELNLEAQQLRDDGSSRNPCHVSSRDGDDLRTDREKGGCDLPITPQNTHGKDVSVATVDNIFQFDDISSRADALANRGSFSSFRSSNTVSVTKSKGTPKN